MTRARLSSAFVVLGLVVSLSGTAVAARQSLSKPDYIEAADNICRQGIELRNEAATANFSTLGSDDQPSPEEMAAYVTDIEPILRQEIDSLRALKPPKADKKKVRKIYKLVEKAVDAIVDEPTLLLTGDQFAKSNAAAQKYGFLICGSESTD